jgi:molybdopterin-containing oxidoreductase family membrane subunit
MCARFALITGLILDYGYLMELFTAYYTADSFDIAIVQNRFFGPYRFASWVMIFCNVLVPQLLWSARVRRSPAVLFVAALLIQIGMWTERYVIVITSLSRDFLKSSWHIFVPTFWDLATLFGSIGLFCFCYLLFARFLPVVAVAEVREEEELRRRRAS